MSSDHPAPDLGALDAIEIDEIRERTFQRAKMYLLVNGLSDPSQLPAEYTDPARLLRVIAAQAARLAAVEQKRNALLATLGRLILETDVSCSCCQRWIETLQAAVSLQGID